ncbi:hypothetical protein [Prescottella equi]|uniref:hypothetical protein n=1 Tax=Rhodococcus hoagii TaxID=43767 RepID=UPI001EEA2749|nr:hypothetical protein [Prescottella equi]
MKELKEFAIDVWDRLGWWEWVVIGLNLFAAVGYGFAGNYAFAITQVCFAIVFALMAWASDLARELGEENAHLRTALRDTVAADLATTEFTIRKPMAYQVTVGGKSPSAVEAAEEAVKDAERAMELAQFKLTRARENAANDLARLNKLLENGSDR